MCIAVIPLPHDIPHAKLDLAEANYITTVVGIDCWRCVDRV